jgi:hypothetical protein
LYEVPARPAGGALHDGQITALNAVLGVFDFDDVIKGTANRTFQQGLGRSGNSARTALRLALLREFSCSAVPPLSNCLKTAHLLALRAPTTSSREGATATVPSKQAITVRMRGRPDQRLTPSLRQRLCLSARQRRRRNVIQHSVGAQLEHLRECVLLL